MSNRKRPRNSNPYNAPREKRHGDPRKAGGTFAGPGGPRDRHGVVVDATDAVLLGRVGAVLIEPYTDGEPGPARLAISLAGRINQTEDLTEILYLTDTDGAARVCAEITGLASRSGAEIAAEFYAAFEAALGRMKDDGAM